jgi:hypothetical protein
MQACSSLYRSAQSPKIAGYEPISWDFRAPGAGFQATVAAELPCPPDRSRVDPKASPAPMMHFCLGDIS